MDAKPYQRVGGEIRLAVRLVPRAARTDFAGVDQDAAGRAFIRARVTPPAEGGKANRALLKLLGKALGLPASRLEIVAGRQQRSKTIRITDDGCVLTTRIDRWLEDMS